MTLFISHASEDASIVTSLETLLNKIAPKLEVRSSSSRGGSGLRPGENWFTWIAEQVTTCDVAIVLVTENSRASQWVSWEVGAAFGSAIASKKRDRVLPLMLGVEPDAVPTPFNLSTARRADDRKQLTEFMGQVVKFGIGQVADDYSDSLLKVGAETGFTSFLNDVENYLGALPGYIFQVNRALQSGPPAHVKDNPVLETAHCHYLEQVGKRIRGWDDHPLVVPSDDYPKILIRVQESLNVKVQAVAIIDDVECFWGKRMGERIWGTSNEQSQRVFVFEGTQALMDYASRILDHGRKYSVRVLGLSQLRARFPNHYHDFSVLSDGTAPATIARYVTDGSDGGTGIEFTAEPGEVEFHTQAFEGIWKAAYDMCDPNSENIEDWAASVFDPRRLEMSKYIAIDDYERYELLHPHFSEMMEVMLNVFQDSRRSAFCKTLEVGAGTGHFTARLLEKLGNGSLFAMELDHECYRWLEKKLRGDQRATVQQEDSATYDPPGKFDFIFSSFADHHICKPDALISYLENIKRNLHPGSAIIVGDEFLPDNDGSAQGISAALKSYHGYIIAEAARQRDEDVESRREAWGGLIQLERAALASGLEQQGDFKVSLSVYLERLTAAGLAYAKPIPIGPKDAALRETVGGIYVVRAHLP